MRHLIFSMFAIALAAVAAIAATTALLNAPMRIGPATGSTLRRRECAAGAGTGAATRHTRARSPANPRRRRATPDAAKPAPAPADAGAAARRRKKGQGSIRGHRARGTAAGPAVQRGLQRELPHEHLTTNYHVRPPLRSPHAVHRPRWRAARARAAGGGTTAREPRFGRAALAAARGRPDEVSLGHWRELGRDEIAARNVAVEVHAHLRALA